MNAKQEKIRVSTGFLLTINVIQAVSFVGLGVYGLLNVKSLMHTGYFLQLAVIGLVAVSSGVGCFISWRCRCFALDGERHTALLAETLESSDKLNRLLRVQRHDFLNHLQVVYGLMEMDEFSEAKSYIERVYDDIQEVSRVLRTANAAVNALLAAKSASAAKRGILMKMEISSRLDALPMPSWELCRILGNLLDNAMDALSDEERRGAGITPDPSGEVSGNTEKKSSRIIQLDIREDIRTYLLRVSDNGHGIPEQDLERIFRPGYSTRSKRDGHGEGMGLAIVSELLAQFGGSIDVASVPGRTSFSCMLPKVPVAASRDAAQTTDFSAVKDRRQAPEATMESAAEAAAVAGQLPEATLQTTQCTR